jgi:hypothetical protein
VIAQPVGGPRRRESSVVQRVDVVARLEQLRLATANPGGDLMARGRLLIERGEFGAARAPLAAAVASIADPVAAAEARFLLHQARIEEALQRLDFTRKPTAADEGAAIAEFDDIAREPYGFGVAAAQMAKATLLMRQGAKAHAENVMLAALTGWRDGRAALPAPASALPDDVARDVADIRATLFRPRGDGAMARERWSYQWPAAPRFVVVSADLFVGTAGAEANRVTVLQSFPAVDNVLLLTTPQVALLRKILTRLAGTDAQAAPAAAIFALWNGFLATPAAFTSLPIPITPPSIDRVTFTSADRTTASVAVGIAHEGATFNLEKNGAGWRLVSITNRWIQ